MSGSVTVGLASGVFLHPGFRSFMDRVPTNPLGWSPYIFGSTFYNSDGTITGNVYYGALDTPVARRVVLFHRASHARVSSTLSRAADGYFEFTRLPKNLGEFYVVAFDNDPVNKRAEAFDSLTPA